MVRYPHKATLISPGAVTWVKGKAVTSESTEEIIDCEVQTDSSNLTVTINGVAVVSQYRVFFANLYQTTKTASKFRFEGKEYDIIQNFPSGHDVKLKIG